MSDRSYSELRSISGIHERFNYLRLGGGVGEETFGAERYLNQRFYTSREWKDVRQFVIARDDGCDLGVRGFEIHDKIYIHHMVTMRAEDLHYRRGWILDPDYLITTTHRTHNAIHYGTEIPLPRGLIDREAGDTSLW